MRASSAGQSALLLLDAIEVLKGEGIEYVVIGAMAAAVHGALRATADADALLSVTVSRLKNLSRAFNQASFTTELREGDANDPIPAMLIVSDAHGNRVELLAGLRGLDRRSFGRALDVPFNGGILRVVGREDFIAMKCFAGGPQDMADAGIAVQSARSLDLDLTRRLARGFGRDAADVLERILTQR